MSNSQPKSNLEYLRSLVESAGEISLYTVRDPNSELKLDVGLLHIDENRFLIVKIQDQELFIEDGVSHELTANNEGFYFLERVQEDVEFVEPTDSYITGNIEDLFVTPGELQNEINFDWLQHLTGGPKVPKYYKDTNPTASGITSSTPEVLVRLKAEMRANRERRNRRINGSGES